MSSTESRDEVLKLLADLCNFYSAYRHHKENTAWLCMALYLGMLAQLAVVMSKPLILSHPEKVALCLLVLMGCAFVLNFVRAQFLLRALAQQRLEACMRIRFTVVSTPEIPIDVSRYAPDRDERLPKIVRDEAVRLAGISQGLRPLLERLSYGLLISCTIASLAWVIAA